MESLPISDGVAVSTILLGMGDFSASGKGSWRAKAGVGRSGVESASVIVGFASEM
jgi:hypothetical protein